MKQGNKTKSQDNEKERKQEKTKHTEKKTVHCWKKILCALKHNHMYFYRCCCKFIIFVLQAYNPVETMAISSQVMNSQNYK